MKDTFSLARVPREPEILGLAGTIPYLATSVTTLFLAWDLTKALPTGNRLFDMVFVQHDTAHYLLDLLQPIQLGYGAVLISFLGAVHWVRILEHLVTRTRETNDLRASNSPKRRRVASAPVSATASASQHQS